MIGEDSHPSLPGVGPTSSNAASPDTLTSTCTRAAGWLVSLPSRLSLGRVEHVGEVARREPHHPFVPQPGGVTEFDELLGATLTAARGECGHQQVGRDRERVTGHRRVSTLDHDHTSRGPGGPGHPREDPHGVGVVSVVEDVHQQVGVEASGDVRERGAATGLQPGMRHRSGDDLGQVEKCALRAGDEVQQGR